MRDQFPKSISKEALELYLKSDVIDLHLDGFIWTRILNYDLNQQNEHGLSRAARKIFGDKFFGHTDFPRAKDAHLTGGFWCITTNPLPTSKRRERALFKNIPALKNEIARSDDALFVSDVSEYQNAKTQNKHAAFIAIQGGNAFDKIESVDAVKDDVVLVTPIHLSRSPLGTSSAPLGGSAGLTKKGRAFIEALNAGKIIVDLAHISRRGFDDAMAVHDKSIPLMSSHTGVCGAHDHWRNLTDEQVKAVADTGGVIGVMFQNAFLGKGEITHKQVIDHVEHVIELVGDDHVAIGSDYDGVIVPPAGLETPFGLPLLVDELLRRGHSAQSVEKFLGGNVLRVLQEVRGVS